jgi:hypothetical protein
VPDAALAIAAGLAAFTIAHVARTIALLRSDDPVPALEDSKVWSAPPPPPPSLNEAMTVVLERGTRLRRCMECRSGATICSMVGFQWSGNEAWAHVDEECMECGHTGQYVVPPMLWTCMEAMRTWESVRTAQAVFRSETSDALDHRVDEA